ncbi:hypothetical protein NQZ68_008734 [Dissostichus eleginoides]|nr:hypothetical protein NQZ68_008734 [Dissostichus eleginoides]
MVDNIATKSALQGSFLSPSSLPLPAPSASSHSLFPGAQSQQPASGGMKLEAVMENLQRQQAARLALEEKLRQAETEKDLRSMVESQIHQQALAFRHYQAAMRGALAAGVANSSPGVTLPHMEVRRADEDSSRPGSDDRERDDEGEDMDEQDLMDEDEEGEEDVGLNHFQHRQSSLLQGACLPPKSTPMHLMARVPAAFAPGRHAESPSAPPPQHHDWTYEEQFKQCVRLEERREKRGALAEAQEMQETGSGGIPACMAHTQKRWDLPKSGGVGASAVPVYDFNPLPPPRPRATPIIHTAKMTPPMIEKQTCVQFSALVSVSLLRLQIEGNLDMSALICPGQWVTKIRCNIN